MRIWFVMCLALCLLVSGCGYRTGSLLPDENIHSIFVQNFHNRTFRVRVTHANKVTKLGIETKLADEVQRRFMLDGTLDVVSKNNADVILEGTILNYSLSPRQFDTTDRRLVAQYGISLVTEVTLRDGATGEILWTDDISKGATYFVTGNLARSEEEAVNDAMSELARDIVIRTVEGL